MIPTSEKCVQQNDILFVVALRVLKAGCLSGAGFKDREAFPE